MLLKTLQDVQSSFLEEFLDWRNRDQWQEAEVVGQKGPFMTYVKEISNQPKEAIQAVERALEKEGISCRWHVRADTEHGGVTRTFLAVDAASREKMATLFEQARQAGHVFSKPPHLHDDEIQMIVPGVNPAFSDIHPTSDPQRDFSEKFDWRDRSAWQEQEVFDGQRKHPTFVKDVTCFSKENLKRFISDLSYADVRYQQHILSVGKDASGQDILRAFVSIRGDDSIQKITTLFQQRAQEKNRHLNQGRAER